MKQKINDKKNIVFLVFIFLYSLVFSAVNIGKPAYWADEGASIAAIHKNYSEIFEMSRYVDIVHLLYYLILKIWASVFGESEFSTRLLSALAVASTSVALWYVGHLLGKASVGITASVIYPIIPVSIWMSTEARSFALVSLMFTVSLALFLKSLSVGRGYYFAFIIFSLFTVYLFVFSILGIISFILLSKKEKIIPVIYSLLVIVLFSMPLILEARSQSAQVEWIGELGIIAILKQVIKYQFFFNHRSLVFLSIIFVFIALIMPSRFRKFAWLLFFCVSVPNFIIAFSGFILEESLYVPRYLSFLTPLFSLLVSCGVQNLIQWAINQSRFLVIRSLVWCFVALSFCVVGSVSINVMKNVKGDESSKSSWGSVRSYLVSHAERGDGVVAFPPQMLLINAPYPDTFEGKIIINQVESSGFPHLDYIHPLMSGVLERTMLESTDDVDDIWYISDPDARNTKDISGSFYSDIDRDINILENYGFHEKNREEFDKSGIVIIHMSHSN